MREGWSAFKMLTGKPIGKRLPRRPRRRWEDRLKWLLKNIWVNTKNWINLAQNGDYWSALVNAEFSFWVS